VSAAADWQLYGRSDASGAPAPASMSAAELPVRAIGPGVVCLSAPHFTLLAVKHTSAGLRASLWYPPGDLQPGKGDYRLPGVPLAGWCAACAG